MAGIWQTLLGGTLAIAGGFLAAWWQTRRADDVARRIRRAERREDGLLAFRTVVRMTVHVVDEAYRAAKGNAEQSMKTWPDIHKAMVGLRDAWETNASGKIPDVAISDKFYEADSLADTLVPWSYPPPPRKDADLADTNARFVEQLGALLAKLKEIRTEVDRRVDDLLHL
jgi:hypothetical protein